jgi:uncharacterized protein (TIGR02246 family)
MKTLVYLVWFAGACALASAQQNKNANASARPITPADEAAIRSLNDNYRQTALEKNWNGWANLFTADALMLPPNAVAVSGRAAIEAWGRALPPLAQFQTPIVEIDGAGNSAVTRGDFTITFAPPNQPEQKDAGKWICTLRKQADGAWRYHRCIFNSNLPAAPQSASVGESDESAKREILATLNTGFDAACAGDPKCFAMFSTSPDTRFATEGTAPTLAEFRKNWDEAMTRVSEQRMTGRESFVQLLASDIAISTTHATYSNVDAKGTPSPTTPFASTAVWQRQPDGWRIINAHQSVAGTWPSSGDSVTSAVKAAVAKHWAAINRDDSATIIGQHTWDMNLFGCEFDQHVKFNTPLGLAIGKRFESAKANWKLSDVEIQPVGNAALAIFNMTGSIRWADGTIDSRPRRVTEVWVNENGTWKEAHHHDSVYAALPKTTATQ